MLDQQGKSTDDNRWPLETDDGHYFFIPITIVIFGIMGIVLYLTWDMF